MVLAAIPFGLAIGIALGRLGGGGSVLAVPVTLAMTAAGVVGAVAGTTLAGRVPRRQVGHGFATMVAAVAAYLIISAAFLGGPPDPDWAAGVRRRRSAQRGNRDRFSGDPAALRRLLLHYHCETRDASARRLCCSWLRSSSNTTRDDGMTEQFTFSGDKARAIGEAIGIDWATSRFDVAQFQKGLDVELEHGIRDPATNVSDDDEITTGKIALAHLNEFPDYYTRLAEMEADAERYWEERDQDPAG